MPKPAVVSVVICTRNRAEQLRRVLESAASIESPQGVSWETLVVDNGSSDHTADVVQSFARRLPIRRVSEPKAGLSNARNRGVAEACGDYICWTDDDVLIDPNWLVAYTEAFERHPDAAYFGGPIELRFEDPTPPWFDENRALLGPLLAERQLGNTEILFDPSLDLVPYGANYAVRAHEQRLSLYDPRLGVSPTQRRLGEETELLAALHHANFEGWWVPDARVLHIIPPERQSLKYFLDYESAAGETAAYLSHRGSPFGARRSIRMSSWGLWGAPVHLWTLMATHLMMYRILRLFGNASAYLPHWLRYGFYKGAIGYWRAKGLDRAEQQSA